MKLFFSLLILLTQGFSLVLIAYVIMSWVVSPFHPARQMLSRFIEPLLQPIRQLMPQAGPFDFSVLVLFLLLYIFESLLRQMYVAF